MGQEVGRFGWIDFIDDREVSKALLDAVEKYGKEKGMEDIVGPLVLPIWIQKACLPGALTS